MIARYLFSYKKTVDNINQQRSKKPQRFDDIEEADFKEIDFDNEKESEDN